AKKTAVPATGTEAGTSAPKKAAKPRKAKVKIKLDSGEEQEIHVPVGESFQHPGDDPVGDVTDGEGRQAAGEEPESAEVEDRQLQAEVASHRADTADEAIDGTFTRQPLSAESTSDATESASDREPARLERLQKILSQAGIASRRHAEELITEG